MAPPRNAAQRRSQSQNENVYDLGVRGRKTGVFLKDDGVRDEHGMQPLDDIFSSPEKDILPRGKENRKGVTQNGDEDESDEGPMEIEDITMPAPAAFMNGARLTLPHARSPPKTHLKSPAMKNPHLGPSSSPTRGSIVTEAEEPIYRGENVKRKLNFSKNALSNKPNLSASKAASARNGVTNGRHSSADDEDEESVLNGRDDSGAAENEDGSMAMLDAGGDDYDGAEEEEEEEEPEADEEEAEEEEEEPDVEPEQSIVEEVPVTAKRRAGRSKKAPAQEVEKPEEEVVEQDEPLQYVEEEPVRAGNKRGRNAKNKGAQEDEVEEQPASKRRRSHRSSSGNEEEVSQPAEKAVEPKPKGRKAGRPKAAGTSAESTAAKSKSAEVLRDPKTGKKLAPKRRPSDIADASMVEVPRGAPPPRSRGLMIVRREAPGAGPGAKTTRAGRTSYKPLAYWKNERIELDVGEVFNDGKSHMILPSVKEIVRVDEPEYEHKTKRKSRPAAGKKGRRRRSAVDDYSDDENNLEPWEVEPGIIQGEVMLWKPEHDQNPPGPDDDLEVIDEQLAMAAGAIQTREIRNATFRFAKTLSMPFFGAGVVDLPPNSEKRTKNSRKMHMSFFVHTGRVLVTVGDTEFRIGKGGMWNVPRGNYYGIENDYDQPARIFFAQGCEISSEPHNGDLSHMAS